MGEQRARDTSCDAAAVEVDASRCTGCGLCARACPCGAITLIEGLPVFHCGEMCTHSVRCVAVACGFAPCAETCPAEAIRLVFEIVLDEHDPVRGVHGREAADAHV